VRLHPKSAKAFKASDLHPHDRRALQLVLFVKSIVAHLVFGCVAGGGAILGSRLDEGLAGIPVGVMATGVPAAIAWHASQRAMDRATVRKIRSAIERRRAFERKEEAKLQEREPVSAVGGSASSAAAPGSPERPQQS
jgi:GAF domain-containing protein